MLAWLMRGDPPLLPIVGPAGRQLDAILAATEIELDETLRARLGAAG